MKPVITTLAILLGITAVAVPLMSLYGKVSWDFAVGFLVILALLSAAFVDYHR